MNYTLEQLSERMARQHGNLDIRCSDIAELPDGLVVPGTLCLRWCGYIRTIPEKISIGGSLDLSFSCIEMLPDGLNIPCDLMLLGCKKIRRLSALLFVEGTLDIRDSVISSVCPWTYVGGDFFVRRSPLAQYPETKLRKQLTVKGKIIYD